MATQQVRVDDSSSARQPPRRKWLLIGLLVVAAIIVAAAALLALKWPFTPERVAKRLADATAATVQIHQFKAEYFPHPGCVAEGLVFRQKGASGQPLMTIQKLTIRGSFPGLFTGHVGQIRAAGAHIALPPLGAGRSLGGNNQSGTVVDQLIADGAVLDVLPKNPGGRPTRFLLRRFELKGLGGSRPLSFQTVVENPEPPGEVIASGHFGPWKTGSAANTAVSGKYSFRHADLSAFRGIAGTLSSEGRFRGTFQNLQVEGTTDAPDFETTHGKHKFHLSAQFRSLVNVGNGDVSLRSVAALLGRTTIGAEGRIAATPSGRGKTATLDFAVENGRIEDILLLFVKEPQSPLMGITSFRGQVTIPPGREAFLRKAQLQGEFGIGGAKFTSAETEKSVSILSQRARGSKEKNDENPERVLSDLRGRVTLAGGVATFSHLSFSVPGARAQMQGTYNLVNKRINLHGLLHMDAKLSNATRGIKSFLLKALGPFLKSNHRGEVLPVSIAGTYDHPSYHLSPNSKK